MAQDSAVWYYTHRDKTLGPETAAAISERIRSQKLSRDTLVWKYGMTSWAQARNHPDFQTAPGKKASSKQTAVSKDGGGTDMRRPIWYYKTNARNFGPIAGSEMAMHLRSGAITPETPIWNDGMGAWTPANEVPEFAHIRPKNGLTIKTRAPHRVAGSAGGETIKTAASPFGWLAGGLQLLSGEGLVLLVVAALIFAVWQVPFADPFAFTLGGFFVIGFTATIATWIRAFQKHWGWFAAVFFLPLADLVYILVDFRKAWRILILSIVAAVGILYSLNELDYQESPYREEIDEFRRAVNEMIG